MCEIMWLETGKLCLHDLKSIFVNAPHVAGESQYIFILEFNDTFRWNGNHTGDSCCGMLLFHSHCSAWLLLYVISDLLFTCSPAVIYCPYYSHLTETYLIILSACYICSVFHLRCCYHIEWDSELIYLHLLPATWFLWQTSWYLRLQSLT